MCFCGVLGRVWGVRAFWLIVAGQVFLWVGWFYLMWSRLDGVGTGVLLVLGTLGVAGLAFGVGEGAAYLWPRRKWLAVPLGLVAAFLSVSLWIALLGRWVLAALWLPVVAPLGLALELASFPSSGYDTGLRYVGMVMVHVLAMIQPSVFLAMWVWKRSRAWQFGFFYATVLCVVLSLASLAILAVTALP